MLSQSTIVINYILWNFIPCFRDALILYMGTEDASEFLSVEMVHRRIQVTWDVGGGAQTIVHPLKLKTNTPSVSDDKRW